MNIKLFLVMGTTWSFEIIATPKQEPEELWHVSDFFNILQGVIVFLIFVCKSKVWEAIKQRLGTFCGVVAIQFNLNNLNF